MNHTLYETWVGKEISAEIMIKLDGILERILSHCISTLMSTDFCGTFYINEVFILWDILYKWGPYIVEHSV